MCERIDAPISDNKNQNIYRPISIQCHMAQFILVISSAVAECSVARHARTFLCSITNYAVYRLHWLNSCATATD